MERPDWVSEAAWVLLEPVFADAPQDALDDLHAACACWDAASRLTLVECFAGRVAAGVPPPAALIVALTELLGARRHE